jgi:hypothetical protein
MHPTLCNIGSRVARPSREFLHGNSALLPVLSCSLCRNRFISLVPSQPMHRTSLRKATPFARRLVLGLQLQPAWRQLGTSSCSPEDTLLENDVKSNARQHVLGFLITFYCCPDPSPASLGEAAALTDRAPNTDDPVRTDPRSAASILAPVEADLRCGSGRSGSDGSRVQDRRRPIMTTALTALFFFFTLTKEVLPGR